MFSQRFTTQLLRHRRIAKLVAGTLAGASLGIGVLGAGPAQANQLPTTVANFCSFNSALGRPVTGAASGEDFAAWTLGTNHYDYFAFDTNGDSHVDIVVWAPGYEGAQTMRDYGLCNGPDAGRWYSAAPLEAQLQAEQQRAEQGSNEYWSEVGPQMEFNMDMEALDDADY